MRPTTTKVTKVDTKAAKACREELGPTVVCRYMDPVTGFVRFVTFFVTFVVVGA